MKQILVMLTLALVFGRLSTAQNPQPKTSAPGNAPTDSAKLDMKLTDGYAKAALLASKAMRDRATETEKLLREADVETVSEGDRLTFALLNALPIHLTSNDLNKEIVRTRASIKLIEEHKPHSAFDVAQAALADPDYQKILTAEQACFSALDKMFRSRLGDLGIFSDGECAKVSPKIREDAPPSGATHAASLHTIGETFAEFAAKEPKMRIDIEHCKAAKKPAPACRAVMAMPTRTDRFSFRLPTDDVSDPLRAPMYTFDGGKLVQITNSP